MKDLSVIIVSYNNLNVLVDAIKSLINTNDIGDRLEIIVVEQSPESQIYDYLIENYPEIITIRAENKGFGAGNNRGAEIAHGQYLLLLNPDTIVLDPIAQFAIDRFNNDSNLGLFGVQILDTNYNRGNSFDMIIPYGLWAKIKYAISKKTGNFFENSMYIQGADIFIRRNLFQEVGMFDEEIFMYCEEPDLCLRVRNAGYNIEFDNSKRIVHLQGACSPDGYGKTYMRQLVSFKYLCDKHGFCFSHIVKKEINYQRVKLFICRLTGRDKKEMGIITREKIIALQSIIKNVSGNKYRRK